MNILTTNGLVGRYVTDWAGPGRGREGGHHPARCAQLPGRHHDPDRLGHRQGAAGDDADGRGRRSRSRRQQPGRPRDRHGAARRRWRTRQRRCRQRLRRHRPASSASARPSSPRSPDARSCASPSRRWAPRCATPGIAPSEVRGDGDLHVGHQPEIDIARSLGIGDLTFFSRIHYGGGARLRHDPAGGAGRGHGRGRRRRRATAPSTSARATASGRRAGPRPRAQRRERPHGRRYLPAVSSRRPPGWPCSAQRYLHMTGATSEDLGPGRRGRPEARGDQPEGVVLRQADHARGPPGQPLDRRAAAPPRLLPGDRRGPGARRHLAWSVRRDLPTTPDRHPRRGAGVGCGAGHDDELLPRRPPRLPEMGVVARQLWETSGLGPADMQAAILYDHFTPFVLYQLEELGFCEGRGQGLRHARATSRSAGACRSTRTAASSARPTSTG